MWLGLQPSSSDIWTKSIVGLVHTLPCSSFFYGQLYSDYLRITYVYKTSINLQFFTHLLKIPRFFHSRIKISVFPNFIFRFYLLLLVFFRKKNSSTIVFYDCLPVNCVRVGRPMSEDSLFLMGGLVYIDLVTFMLQWTICVTL